MYIEKKTSLYLLCPAADHSSKTYGINRSSSLLGVRFYSMFNGGLPHDMMHDILEGVDSHEL